MLCVDNAQHVKGSRQKSALNDAACIAKRYAMGSCGQLYTLHAAAATLGTWYGPVSRTTSVRVRARCILGVQAVLEGANITLASVATCTRGISARALLEARMTGNRMSALAHMAWGAPDQPGAGSRSAPRRLRILHITGFMCMDHEHAGNMLLMHRAGAADEGKKGVSMPAPTTHRPKPNKSATRGNKPW